MNKDRFFTLATKYKIIGDHLSPQEQQFIESFADELFPKEKLAISDDFFNKLTKSTLFRTVSQHQVNFMNDICNEAIKQDITKKELATLLAILYWNHKFRQEKYSAKELVTRIKEGITNKQSIKISHITKIFLYCINN